MEIKIDKRSHFVFDLDDTLYLEQDYLYSAFRSIAAAIREQTGQHCFHQMVHLYKSGENVFQWIARAYGVRFRTLSFDTLLHHYRSHQPSISMARGAGLFLQQLKHMQVPMGIITDGRSITQRNKLKALGIETFFSDIIISEEFGSTKPSIRNYEYFIQRNPSGRFYFFGDNTQKDFQVPIDLGWSCYCIKDNGDHIHPQTFNDHPPFNIIATFYDIRLVKNKVHEG